MPGHSCHTALSYCYAKIEVGMEDKVWKTALWNRSWDDLKAKKYNAEGVCQFSEDKGVHLVIPSGDLSLTRKLAETGRYEIGMESDRYEYLFGITQDGIYLVLIDAISNRVELSFPGHTRESLEASTVLSSHDEFDPSIPISTADFEIEGLRKWLGLQSSPEIREDNLVIEGGRQNEVIDVYRSDRCAMTIHSGFRKIKSDHEGFRDSTYATVHVDYKNGVSLDDFWSCELWKFQSFLSFCFGAYASIRQVRVKFKDNGSPVEVHRGSFPTRNTIRNYQCVPVPFQLIKSILFDVVTRWMEMKGDESQSSKMLASLLGSWKIPVDLKFFAASSMFESLARSGCDECFDKKDLERLITPMLRVADESIRDRARGLLGLLRQPSYSMLLDHAYEESDRWGRGIVPDWKRFRKEQNKLRNASAHALENNSEYEQMVDHHDAQILIAYVIIMKRLKLPDEVLDQFEDSTFMNVSRWRVSEHYASNDSHS